MLTQARAFASLLLVAAACSSSGSGTTKDGTCKAAEGTVVVFEPAPGATTGDPSQLKPAVDKVPGAQLVIGEKEVALFLESRTMESVEAGKTAVVPQAKALGYDFRAEDFGSIDQSCTIKLEHHPDSPIRPR